MAFLNDMSRYGCLSINEAPFFEGSDYVYWNTRMMSFLKSESTDIWQVIGECPFVPNKMVNGEIFEKPKEEWNEY